MPKFTLLLVVLSILLGCNSSESPQSRDAEPLSFEAISLPEPVAIRPEARVILDGWPQFMSLEKRLTALEGVDEQEELKLLLEELSQICEQIEKNAIPEPFETPSVRSRLKIFRTYLGKLDAALYYRLDHREPLDELLGSYDALRSQFNVIVSNRLTPELFEDE